MSDAVVALREGADFFYLHGHGQEVLEDSHKLLCEAQHVIHVLHSCGNDVEWVAGEKGRRGECVTRAGFSLVSVCCRSFPNVARLDACCDELACYITIDLF